MVSEFTRLADRPIDSDLIVALEGQRSIHIYQRYALVGGGLWAVFHSQIRYLIGFVMDAGDHRFQPVVSSYFNLILDFYVQDLASNLDDVAQTSSGIVLAFAATSSRYSGTAVTRLPLPRCAGR